MTRPFIRAFVIAGYVTILLADALCQQPQAKRSPAAGEGAEHPVVSRVPPDMLAQFSGSLEQLAAEVSPAVVQIQVANRLKTWWPGTELNHSPCPVFNNL